MAENQDLNEATSSDIDDDQLEQIAGGGFRRSRSAWHREMEKLEKEREQKQQQQNTQGPANPPASAE